MDAVRAGALRDRPVTVLGFARSGIALARFLADAGARVTIYDGRPARELAEAIDRLEGRPVTLALGPEVDPATAWAGAALVTTSPSINPDYPTTEPRLRAALQAMVAARAGRRRRRPGAHLRAGPVPAPVRGPDDRRHRHEGQDDDVRADRDDPRRRPDATRWCSAGTSGSR